MPRPSAVLLSRWLVADSLLGRSRYTLLSWLAGAGGGGRTRGDTNAAVVRAKAIRLLGKAVEVDVGALGRLDVQVRGVGRRGEGRAVGKYSRQLYWFGHGKVVGYRDK